MTGDKILEIKNLHVYYLTEEETIRAVNGLNLEVSEGESVGLVGETGAGKTTACLAVMQLVPDPPGVIADGEILYKGENLIYASEKRHREIRGNGISMIFQDPMTALNPVMTIGQQLMEVVQTHQKLGRAQAKDKVIKILEIVGVKGDRFNDYPHQFSGGMKQRVVITMALLCQPELLIADEPTTALDVTIQAQVLEIIRKLQKDLGTSMLLISHDLGVVAEICTKVAIMYAGEIVEFGTVPEVFRSTRHPYTRGLFESIPRLESKSEKLTPIDGLPPNPADLPCGCAFHPRCRHRKPVCEREEPPMRGEGHIYKCHFEL
ncbi:MAG: ABC transporter ATP-binding protein [Clostridiales bacterium]|jgi:oligopeptide/dipeptide ABC transporter ATP-binding protein|nr:ABC transporter ATP-binding protein [Clostridiales bacterium]